MKQFTLVRFATTPFGTFGRLYFPPEETTLSPMYTVEKEWLLNAPGYSCIPDGNYAMKRSVFHRGNYGCLELLDVPNRSEIKIHIANLATELRGCIAPGLCLGMVKDEWAVMKSTTAFNRLMAYIDSLPPNEELRINIRAADLTATYHKGEIDE